MKKKTQNTDIPSGKLKRFSKASKTAVKIIGKQALHAASQTFRSKAIQETKKNEHHQDIAITVFKTLATRLTSFFNSV